jgi:spore germination protein YaaH
VSRTDLAPVRRVGLLLAAVLIAASCGGTPPSVDRDPLGDGATERPSQAQPATPVPDPKHEVYGFVPYWEMDDTIADHLATVELTTLALFSVTHTRRGELDGEQNGARRIQGELGQRMIREAHERGTRVELVYTAFGAGKNPAAQARWIEVLVELVAALELDGVNVDVEGLPVEHVLDYGTFVGDLRNALLASDPDAQVSVATQANDRGAAMALAAAAAGADRIFLMGYDYHWEGSNAGATSPIDRLDGEERDLVWSLDRYASLGVPVDRTILGLPLYGLTWPVIGPGVGSPATGRGDDWVPRRNLRVFEDPLFEPQYEPVQSVEFYSVPTDPADPDAGWDAVYYDSPRSLAPKLALADARGLAGAGFWAIGYERGLPGYGELISTFKAGELALTGEPE